MTDRNKTIPDLDTINVVSVSDLLIVEDISTGQTMSTTVQQFFDDSAETIGEVLVLTQDTPANSTINVASGRVYYDSSYLYVAVANNTLKRVSLTNF